MYTVDQTDTYIVVIQIVGTISINVNKNPYIQRLSNNARCVQLLVIEVLQSSGAI